MGTISRRHLELALLALVLVGGRAPSRARAQEAPPTLPTGTTTSTTRGPPGAPWTTPPATVATPPATAPTTPPATQPAALPATQPTAPPATQPAAPPAAAPPRPPTPGVPPAATRPTTPPTASSNGEVDDISDAPLDPETLALVEALTATPTEAGAPLAPVWGRAGPLERPIEAERLRETLAPRVDRALDELPVLNGSLRGALGVIRRLDGLRVEPTEVDLGRLDPWLYGPVVARRGPSGAEATRLWTSEIALSGRPLPGAPGAGGRVALDARTADRGWGALATGWVGGGPAALCVSASLRGRGAGLGTSTSTSSLDLGVSARARLGPPPGPSGGNGTRLGLEVGYDLALGEEGARGTTETLHLLQSWAWIRVGAVSARIGGGWVGMRGTGGARDFLQAAAQLRWTREESAQFELEALPDDPDRARVRVWIRPSPATEVEAGGLILEALGDQGSTRAELWTRASQRLGPLALELSARLSDQRSGPVEPELGLALDIRAAVDLAGPFGLWARYARSYAFLETGGIAPETADLLEGGPRFEGGWGWLHLGLWGARVDAGEAPTIDLWGLAAEGALELGPWSLTGSLYRAQATGDGAVLDPQPALRGRGALRARHDRWGAFLELGARVGFEAPGEPAGRGLLPPSAETPPFVVLDLRGGIDLPAGFQLGLAVANGLDGRWSPIGSAEPAPGLDARLRLAWASP